MHLRDIAPGRGRELLGVAPLAMLPWGDDRCRPGRGAA
jgi:hypothetical protein